MADWQWRDRGQSPKSRDRDRVSVGGRTQMCYCHLSAPARMCLPAACSLTTVAISITCWAAEQWQMQPAVTRASARSKARRCCIADWGSPLIRVDKFVYTEVNGYLKHVGVWENEGGRTNSKAHTISDTVRGLVIHILGICLAKHPLPHKLALRKPSNHKSIEQLYVFSTQTHSDMQHRSALLLALALVTAGCISHCSAAQQVIDIATVVSEQAAGRHILAGAERWQ